MNYSKSLLAALLLVVFAVACGSNPQKKQSELVTDTGPFPRYLVNIPADTPYAFAAIEPIPARVFERFRKQLKPQYDKMRPIIDQFANDEDLVSRVVVAGFEVVYDKIMNEGLTAIGLPASPTFVVYGVGVFPTMRMRVGDRAKLESTINSFLQRAGLQLTAEEIEGRTFRSFSHSDLTGIISFGGDDLVVGFSPSSVSQQYVPYAIGTKKPVNSFANANLLEQVQTEYGFKKLGVGFVDLTKIYEYVLISSDSKSALTLPLQDIQARTSSAMTPECISEARALVAQAPRLVFGYDELTESHLSVRGGIELQNGLGADIANTKTSMPLAGSPMLSDSLATLGVGFDVGKMINLVRARFDNVRREPFQCAELSEINRIADQVVQGTILIPAQVAGIQGLSVALTDFNYDANTRDVELDGIAVVSSTSASALYDLLGAFVPTFAGLTVTPNGPPVPFAFPEPQLTNTHIFMTDTMLAVTSGSGVELEGAAEVKRVKPSSASPFALFRYNFAGVADKLPADFDLRETFESLGAAEATFELVPESRGVFLRMNQPLEPQPPESN